MTAQTSYGETPEIGFAGMLAQQFSLRQVDSGIAEGNLDLARAVKTGSSDGQYVAAGADEAVTGVVIYSGSSENQSGAFQYLDKAQLPVLSKGRFYAIAAGLTVIGDELAQVVADRRVGPVAAGLTTLAFGYAKTSASSAGELIVVEVAFAPVPVAAP